jgi:hypothetical protein
MPADFEAANVALIADYDNLQCHEGIGNLMVSDLCLGRSSAIPIGDGGSDHSTQLTC